MGIKMEETTSDYQVVPFGTYTVRLKDLTEERKRDDWLKAEPDPTKPVDAYQWKWVFAIVGGEWEGAELWGFTARTIGHSKAGAPYKARAWVDALWGGRYPYAVIEDSDVLIGKECLCKVDDTKKDGQPGNRIIGILPLGGEQPLPLLHQPSEEPDIIPSPSKLTERYNAAKEGADEGNTERLRIAWREIVPKGKKWDDLPPAIQLRVVLAFEEIVEGEIDF